jgi:hypothetical protein
MEIGIVIIIVLIVLFFLLSSGRSNATFCDAKEDTVKTNEQTIYKSVPNTMEEDFYWLVSYLKPESVTL